MADRNLETMEDVRASIDAIDDQLVELLARRLYAIRRASEIKNEPSDALVRWRVEEVAARVRERSAHVGFDPGTAERIWRAMMDECIDFERRALAARKNRR
jgi:isochorismate pyruvate lyase